MRQLLFILISCQNSARNAGFLFDCKERGSVRTHRYGSSHVLVTQSIGQKDKFVVAVLVGNEYSFILGNFFLESIQVLCYNNRYNHNGGIEMGMDFINAVRVGDVDAVRRYIDEGADINQLYVEDIRKNKIKFNSMLGLAIDNGRAQVAKMLIDAGVDVNERFLNDPDFYEESNPMLLEDGFDVAGQLNKIGVVHEKLVKAYEARGLDLNERLRNPNLGAEYDTDYMFEAINGQHTEIIKALLEAGFDTANIPQRPGHVYRSSHYLARVEHVYGFHNKASEMTELYELFLAQDIDFDIDGMKELATRNRWAIPVEIQRGILAKAMDINEQDMSGKALLHHALEDKKSIFLDAILDAGGVDVNLFDYEDKAPLYYAVKNHGADVVRALLQMGADVDALNGRTSEPLALTATSARNAAALEVLCEFGASLDGADDRGKTLLHTVCEVMDIEWIRLLIKNGADHAVTDNKGNAPLHLLAAAKRHPKTTEMIDLLIENGAALDAFNNDLRTPFFVSNEPMILKHLLSLGAMVDPQDIRGNTPLHNAIDADNPQMVKFLLEAGADNNVQNEKDESPYQMALAKNRRAIISMIEKSSVTIDLDGDDMDAAFMRACKGGRRGVAEMLVRSGNIDTTYVDDFGRTPLHYIAKMGMTALANFLISQGVDVDYTDNAGQTALHFAAGNRQKEVFKLLINNGADMDIADDKGVLPIHLVTNRGQHDLLALMLAQGADPHTITDKGESLLHVAAYTRSRECVRLLLEYGADPNTTDRLGTSPLVTSVNINQKEIAKMLLDQGADIRSQNTHGDEAIHIAAIRGFKDMLNLLIDHGSDIDALNNLGLAPLHLAAYGGYKDIFKFLLDRGANFEIKTATGKSVMDIAAENGQKELIELIGIIQKRREAMS
ncbi:MAG: ankyrin repeat domain-containing protein [Defluviitaleaceae bacterium]|nr:ankyrin repeat domain-containing protein [Defluviitaleaceae bacterium]